MAIWTTIRSWLSRERQRRDMTEWDAPVQTGGAHARETGGVDEPDAGGDDPSYPGYPRHRRGNEDINNAT